MRLKAFGLLAAVSLLAACASEPASNGNVATGGSSASVPSSSSESSVVPGSREDFRVNVGDRVFFDYDKSDITAEGRQTLEKQAAWLKQYPQVKVTLEGHCDERGTREYNLALGERRANAAKKVLLALGVSANRLKTTSLGKENPDPVGSDEAAWAQNRRSTTVIE
jgi:peptidoglycan-associated lipoprotein